MGSWLAQLQPSEGGSLLEDGSILRIWVPEYDVEAEPPHQPAQAPLFCYDRER